MAFEVAGLRMINPWLHSDIGYRLSNYYQRHAEGMKYCKKKWENFQAELEKVRVPVDENEKGDENKNIFINRI